MIAKVKDSSLLVWKNIERIEDSWGFQYDRNDGIERLFGYKCQYQRNPKTNLSYMEIYFPTMLDKCKQKHCEREDKYKAKPNKIEKTLRSSYVTEVKEKIDQEDLRIALQNEPIDPRVIDALEG